MHYKNALLDHTKIHSKIHSNNRLRFEKCLRSGVYRSKYGRLDHLNTIHSEVCLQSCMYMYVYYRVFHSLNASAGVYLLNFLQIFKSSISFLPAMMTPWKFFSFSFIVKIVHWWIAYFPWAMSMSEKFITDNLKCDTWITFKWMNLLLGLMNYLMMIMIMRHTMLH